jgi:hypothetical protein
MDYLILARDFVDDLAAPVLYLLDLLPTLAFEIARSCLIYLFEFITVYLGINQQMFTKNVTSAPEIKQPSVQSTQVENKSRQVEKIDDSGTFPSWFMFASFSLGIIVFTIIGFVIESINRPRREHSIESARQEEQIHTKTD